MLRKACSLQVACGNRSVERFAVAWNRIPLVRDWTFMIITIDGPAGSGKSTVSRLLAERLGFRFLDTGAMYRAIALAVLRVAAEPADRTATAAAARSAQLQFMGDRLLLNGEDVSLAIRAPEVSAAASIVAASPEVRERMVELQREAGDGGRLVTEGRDQGTVVFPTAECKFFLTASVSARAERRVRDLQQRGIEQSLEEVRQQIQDRDRRDEERELAPMKPADDAIVLETSELSIDEVLERMLQLVQESPDGHA
jgi:cytidylate kinase